MKKQTLLIRPEYWQKRYESLQIGWDIGDVSTPLKAYIDQLPPEAKSWRVLIPGAGNAYEAEYLHQKGFRQVIVVDWAKEPLENLQSRCPDFPEGNLVQSDFFKLEQASFDLILEQTFFCALSPNLRERYAVKMANLLAPKGKLVGVLFNIPLNSDKPPFGADREEYATCFSPHFEFIHFADCYNSIPPRAGNELFIILQKK